MKRIFLFQFLIILYAGITYAQEVVPGPSSAPHHIEDNLVGQTDATVQAPTFGEAITLEGTLSCMDIDPERDYYNIDPNTRNAFIFYEYNDQLPSFSNSYLGDGPFQHRRISAYNVTIPMLYKLAYQISDYRMVLEADASLFDREKEANKMGLTIIVEQPEELYPAFQQQLNAFLPFKARLEQRMVKIYVLTKDPDREFAGTPVSSTETGYFSRGSTFETDGSPIEHFREYLENFEILGGPVIDETGIDGYFSFDFSFDWGDPESLRDAMRSLGLSFREEVREITMVVLYEDQQ